MATYLDGGVRKATANTVTSMRHSAVSRQCPKCGRKSALKHHSDDLGYGSYCRWADCGYENIKSRHYGAEQ